MDKFHVHINSISGKMDRICSRKISLADSGLEILLCIYQQQKGCKWFVRDDLRYINQIQEIKKKNRKKNRK